MAQGPRSRRRDGESSADTAINQAQYMVRIYGEILAMHDSILDRVRLLVRSDDGEREAKMANLRLILAQVEKLGGRIAYWNSRVRKLIEEQLAP